MKDVRLEVSDLMAGDWVRSKKWAEIPFKLTSLNANMRYYYGITSKGVLIGPFLIEELEPIPITKEILEKIGFVNDYYEEGCVADYGYIKHDGYTLTYKNEEVDAIITWCNGCVSITTEHGDDAQITIKYLHELQHAFKLCRIKKEIEL